ncbi:hypothetical protein CRE_19454 [Caenorhabditis remanei]|uniref:Uncharacterized protein n=1 Tax=Caenorhabditis remanei TaxID=31234 RepID=E3NA24_CAERE|nr:hypothetical protein CRE_19454 [Caenorhabditis remanei]
MGFISEIKYLIQCIVLVFSLFVNSLFFYLVIAESPKKLGNYKYLMCYFSIISMIYSIVDFLVQPVILSLIMPTFIVFGVTVHSQSWRCIWNVYGFEGKCLRVLFNNPALKSPRHNQLENNNYDLSL